MNIAMISYHTCPRASAEGKETGGMNVYVLELSRALARMGHSVDIFTRSHEANDPLVINEAPNLRVMHIEAGPRAPIDKKSLPSYIPAFVREAKAFVLREKGTYDVMHAHYYQSGLAAEEVLRENSVPFVMSFHTLALMKNLVARDESEKESDDRIAIEKRLVSEADRIIASSDMDKQYLSLLYDAPERALRVVLPGVDPSLFHPLNFVESRKHIHADPSHKIVLFVGRIEPLKGIDTLLYAMKILEKEHLPVCAWIVGGDVSDSPDRWPKTLRELTKIRKVLGICEDRIHFVGMQPQTELPYFYNAADVVVMPSHYESFGMAALEAMACGTPVITTNVTGIAPHLTHVTTVGNPLHLAKQIVHIFTHHSRGEARQTPLTWDNAATKLISVYSELTR